jgi:hypothetical protein
MRLHPKSRASTDHTPGPNIARAAPKVAIRRYTNLCAGAVKTPQISVRATRVPTMGVYRPTIRRIPAPARRTGTTAVAMGGSASTVEAALPTKTSPTTKRIRMRPMPGQPPAKVEYKRRNGRTSPIAIFLVLARNWRPRSGLDSASFEAAVRLVGLYSSMIPRFRAMVVAWVRSLAPNLERMFFTRLFTDSSVVES